MTADIERFGFWHTDPPSRYRKHTPSARLLADVEWLTAMHQSGRSGQTQAMFKSMRIERPDPAQTEYNPFGIEPRPRLMFCGGRLTEKAIWWIYRAKGTITMIANHTGVSDSTICLIKTGAIHTDVTRHRQ